MQGNPFTHTHAIIFHHYTLCEQFTNLDQPLKGDQEEEHYNEGIEESVLLTFHINICFQGNFNSLHDRNDTGIENINKLTRSWYVALL